MTQDTRYATRSQKSEKILSILYDFLGPDLKRYTCLDVGCSNGGISHSIAAHFKSIVGIDVDRPAVILANSSNQNENSAFAFASGHDIPFPTGTFDVSICAQVYEHTTDQQALAREIWRILRPGGICFFSGPNRLAVVEEHYWLPFLSWLPRPLSNLYMRIFQRGNFYDAYPLYYWQIRKLWQPFVIYDYTFRLIESPHLFGMDRYAEKIAWISKLPGWIIRALTPFYPNYNWILQKPE